MTFVTFFTSEITKIGKLEPHVLAGYVQQHLIPKLDSEDYVVRMETVIALRMLEPRELTKHAQDIIPVLGDVHWVLRMNAVHVLGRVEPRVLAKYTQYIVLRLDDEEYSVRLNAVEALGNLEPQVLAGYVQHIILRLGDEVSCVRMAAIEALGKLEPLVLAKYAEDILQLYDRDGSVRVEAIKTLKKVPLLALVSHRYALRCVCKGGVGSLRGRVWLVRWRQLFWGERLLWWWCSGVWKPGSRQAGVAASEFGQMQGVSVEEEERGVKRARVA